MRQDKDAEPEETRNNGDDNIAEIPLLEQGSDLLVGRRYELDTGNKSGADNQEGQGVIGLQRYVFN